MKGKVASGFGEEELLGKDSSVWKRFLYSSHDPSQAAAGSRVLGALVVPVTISRSLSSLSPPGIELHPATMDVAMTTVAATLMSPIRSDTCALLSRRWHYC